MRPRLALALAAVVMLGSCARSADKLATREIRIALPRDAINWLPVHLAQSLGYCEQEGVSLALSDVPGLSKGIEALLGGSVDVAGGSPIMAIQMAADGRPVQAFFVLNTRPNVALVALPQSGVRTIDDLKGKRVGVSSLGSPTETFLDYLVISHGMTKDDVSPIAIGTGAASVAAVEHQQVDAASVVGSVIPMLHRRHPDLVFLLDTRRPETMSQALGSPAFPNIALMARQDWLASHGDAARRLVRAVKRAMEWIRQRPPEDIRAQIPETDRMPDPEADLESIRDMQRALNPAGSMPSGSAEAVRRVLAASNEKVRGAALDLSRTFTNDFTSTP